MNVMRALEEGSCVSAFFFARSWLYSSQSQSQELGQTCFAMNDSFSLRNTSGPFRDANTTSYEEKGGDTTALRVQALLSEG